MKPPFDETSHITALDYAIGDYFMGSVESGLSRAETEQRVGSLLIQAGITMFRDHTQISDALIQAGVAKMLALPPKSPEETLAHAREIIKRRAPQ